MEKETEKIYNETLSLMNYKIRRRTKEDCEKIAHIVTIAWNETYKGIVPDEFLNDLYANEQMRAQNSYNNFDENDNHQFVIEIGNKIVGFVNVGKSDKYDNCGEIFALYLIKQYKGYGFGRKLVEKGIEELKNMNYNKMVIGCLEKNPSNEFYKHLGGKFIKKEMFKKLNLLENIYLYENI